MQKVFQNGRPFVEKMKALFDSQNLQEEKTVIGT